MFFFFKQKTAYEISACLVGSEMCIRDRRCTMYTATVTGALPHTNSPARTWAVTDTNEYKIDSGWHTGTYSIASVQGMNYVYVGNWGNGNASSVYVQKLWLT